MVKNLENARIFRRTGPLHHNAQFEIRSLDWKYLKINEISSWSKFQASRFAQYCQFSACSYLVRNFSEHWYKIGCNQPVKLNQFDHGPVWISLVLHILWPIHACDASIFMFDRIQNEFLEPSTCVFSCTCLYLTRIYI